MPRASTVFVCSACAAETPRWMGQCPGCNEWNTLTEETRGKPVANGRTVKFPDGRDFFFGSSGNGAPEDGSDKAGGRGAAPQ